MCHKNCLPKDDHLIFYVCITAWLPISTQNLDKGSIHWHQDSKHCGFLLDKISRGVMNRATSCCKSGWLTIYIYKYIYILVHTHTYTHTKVWKYALDYFTVSYLPHFQKEYHQQFGKIFKEKLGKITNVSIADPNIIEELARKEGVYPFRPPYDSWVLYKKDRKQKFGIMSA